MKRLCILIIMLNFSLCLSCERNMDYTDLLPHVLPISSGVQSEVVRFSGYNRWRVYIKFKCDFSEFEEYVRRIGCLPCEAYQIPYSTSAADPQFWDYEQVAKDENRRTFLLKSHAIIGPYSYDSFAAIWSKNYGYLYFIVSAVE